MNEVERGKSLLIMGCQCCKAMLREGGRADEVRCQDEGILYARGVLLWFPSSPFPGPVQVVS